MSDLQPSKFRTRSVRLSEPAFDTVIRGGTVATASDVFSADLGVRDGQIAAIGRAPDRRVTLADAMVEDRTGFTPYVGRTVTGWPETVLCRGRVIAEGGAATAEAGSGAPIRRG
ncbi:hypothetical protein FF100_27790 [Methylobacterium terricola]|uniref:Urease alpha-subunit N-terminal domain-containing protein n=1 Tax=Methylobacterium terricola TaxID=2583531 RepID=A0A5C4L9F6_9HYPH|nr:hypothetical protein [Methylobacterium terricola]TNC09099.1 hypothetical protein FF100_27790 [Methylobacterium terricola]